MQSGPSTPSTEPQHESGTPPSSPAEHFNCNICLNIASDAVVTTCGHLFCWPCLYTWLHYHSRYKECPVCKGATSVGRVVPIYSWGCKDGADLSKSLGKSSNSIPPRPPARRVESERQRRQRFQVDRRQQATRSGSDMHHLSLNQVLPGRHGCYLSTDSAVAHAPGNLAPSDSNSSNVNAANASQHVMGRETRASWLERLRAMREERLVWPVAFVQGLTSRELLQQRRQAREHTLSPRLSLDVMPDRDMIDAANADVAGWYSPSGQAQSGALQRALSLASLDRDLRHLTQIQSMPAVPLPGVPNRSHTAQYLATMSSILSSMEVFARALELSSSSAMAHGPLPSTMMPHPLQVFNTQDEEHALWQSSMRALLLQMERLTLQLQNMYQPFNNSHSAANNHILQNSWMSTTNAPLPAHHHHHHHHHHYHMDGSLSDRSTPMVNPLGERGFLEEGDVRYNVNNNGSVLGLSPGLPLHSDINVSMANPTVPHSGHSNNQALGAPFPAHLNQFAVQNGPYRDFHNANSKSRKRWDVTRMSN